MYLPDSQHNQLLFLFPFRINSTKQIKLLEKLHSSCLYSVAVETVTTHNSSVSVAVQLLKLLKQQLQCIHLSASTAVETVKTTTPVYPSVCQYSC